jgi:hypothetical protein
MRIVISIAMSLASFLVMSAADAAYFGTWKYNQTKSDLGPAEMVVTKSGDDFRLSDIDKKSYTFKMDGKGYTEPYGSTVTWKQLTDNAWDAAYVLNGKAITTEHYVLSADGKTLTVRSAVQTDRGPAELVITFNRDGAGTGLVGRWTGKIHMSPFVLEITPQPNDGLLFRVSGVFESNAKFDGKPYPMTGPLAQKGSTASFTHIDARSFKTTQVDPTVTIEATVAVSADGKTLTQIGKMSSGSTRKWVFDRQ